MSRIPYDIVRSDRRAKTVQAKLIDGRVRVTVPASMDETEANRVATELVGRIERKRSAGLVDLSRRAGLLADRHGLPRPSSITWSDRQQQRWGSCTPAAGAIRISTRLATFPIWVLDSVIVHELAHLAEPNHGPEFEHLVGRYPFTERARGYLLAISDGTVG